MSNTHAPVPLVELEICQLDLKHAALRIADPQSVARLALALEAHGQGAPVVVVEPQSGSRPVVIDGFVRIGALRRLRVDTVWALMLPLGEQEALTWCYRQQQGRRPTALEEGWLVAQLHLVLEQSLALVAAGLERSTSWASRRLGLVRELPEFIQEQVRRGAVSPYAAMRTLLPLARTNAEAATRLARVSRDERLTTRELERLCAAWRAADGAQREQLLAKPRLYLRVSEHVGRHTTELAAPALVRDFDLLTSIARRARRTLCDVKQREQAGATEALLVAWPRVCGAFRELTEVVQEQSHAVP